MKNNLKKYEDNKEEVEKMEENKRKTIVLTIIAVSCLLIVVFGATYAYFQVLSSNNVSTTNTQGQIDTMPKGTLVTNTALLKLNLDANLMSEENANTIYYATESGTPVTVATEGSGKYVLATASLYKTGISYDCTYSYRISASKTKAINDGSAADVKVKITGSDGYTEIFTLAQLLAGNKAYTGKIKGLTYGTNQKIYVEAYVENTNKTQDDLAGNSFNFMIKLIDNSFSCDVPLDIEKEAKGKEFAQFLANNNKRVDNLWTSGLEDDGYRYIGSGKYLCSYDKGNYKVGADNQYTNPSCSNVYKIERTTIPNNYLYVYYDTSCPSNNSTYTYSCTGPLVGELNNSDMPNNFICFGTSDKTECKNNESKYMYRIIGVFPDSNGKQHLKLISFKQLGAYKWNADYQTDVSWENSDMYKGLNGSYFLNNTTYDYMQNSTWLNKIENWKWTAVNTKTYESSGPNYYSGLSPSKIYLDEMNRSSKTSSIGEWTTPSARIGLMYASDYTLSLGYSALSMTSGTYQNRFTLKTGWMHQSNNDTTKSIYEWTLSRFGAYGGDFGAWRVYSGGQVYFNYVNYAYGVRPVFHLTSDVRINDGDGSYSNPYILE